MKNTAEIVPFLRKDLYPELKAARKESHKAARKYRKPNFSRIVAKAPLPPGATDAGEAIWALHNALKRRQDRKQDVTAVMGKLSDREIKLVAKKTKVEAGIIRELRNFCEKTSAETRQQIFEHIEEAANELQKDHSTLMDGHDNLVEGQKRLERQIEDVGRGVKDMVRGSPTEDRKSPEIIEVPQNEIEVLKKVMDKFWKLYEETYSAWEAIERTGVMKKNELRKKQKLLAQKVEDLTRIQERIRVKKKCNIKKDSRTVRTAMNYVQKVCEIKKLADLQRDGKALKKKIKKKMKEIIRHWG